jgi:transcription elongation factor Elf1
MFGNLFSSDTKMRCPFCGAKSSRKLEDKKINDPDDVLGILDKMNRANPELARYTNNKDRFSCKNCGQEFSGPVSVDWEKIAKKLGEDVAIREYKKLK